MSEYRPADTAALIVIDLQTAMFDGTIEPPIHDADGLVARVRAVIEWARRTRRRIAFVRGALVARRLARSLLDTTPLSPVPA